MFGDLAEAVRRRNDRCRPKVRQLTKSIAVSADGTILDRYAPGSIFYAKQDTAMCLTAQWSRPVSSAGALLGPGTIDPPLAERAQ